MYTKKYSIRKLGCTSWYDTDSVPEAIKERKIANRIVSSGHVIINNENNTIETAYNYRG